MEGKDSNTLFMVRISDESIKPVQFQGAAGGPQVFSISMKGPWEKKVGDYSSSS